MDDKKLQEKLQEKFLGLFETMPKVSGSEFLEVVSTIFFLHWCDQHEIDCIDEAHERHSDHTLSEIWCVLLQYLQDDVVDLDQLERLEDNIEKKIEVLPPFCNRKIAELFRIIIHVIRKSRSLPSGSARRIADLFEEIMYTIISTRYNPRMWREMLCQLSIQLSHKVECRQFTPRKVAEMMVAIAKPKIGESVYDPCFGTAALLTSAADFVLKNNKNIDVSKAQPIKVGGADKLDEKYVLGLIQLTLSGILAPQLVVEDSLELTTSDVDWQELRLDCLGLGIVEPGGSERLGVFDVVLMDPPWGARDLLSYSGYQIPSKNEVSLFLQHALEQLKPNGRIVAVVPKSYLHLGGCSRSLREILVREHTVETVIAMPRDSFLPQSKVESCVVMIRKGNATKSVRMIDLSDQELHSDNFAVDLIEDAVELLRMPKPDGQAWDVDFQTLEECDFDLTPARRNQSSLKEIVCRFNDHVESQALGDICSISTGHAIPQKLFGPFSSRRDSIRSKIFDLRSKIDKLDEASPSQRREIEVLWHEADILGSKLSKHMSDALPYIRIRDVSNGQLLRGKTWFDNKEFDKIRKRQVVKLNVDDLLVSKSGTIGKSAIVGKSAAGAVASSGFFALRLKNDLNIDPSYLLAYLNSAECSQWLKERSRGAKAKSLSMKSIGKLPVPIPSIEVQRRVGGEYLETKADALDTLAWELLGERLNPVQAWLIETWRKVSSSNESTKPQDSQGWEEIALQLRPLRNELTHTPKKESETLELWAVQFYHALSPLVGFETIPDAPSRLAVLNELIKRSKLTLEHLNKEEAAIIEKAVFVNRCFIDWLEDQSETLLDHDKVSIACDTTELPVGNQVEMVVDIENKGALALRDLVVVTKPEGWGESKVDFLAGGTSHQFNLDGQSPSQLGRFNIEIHWSGTKLTGEPVEGSSEIGFNVVASENVIAKETDLGGSPYICGDPVKTDRDEVFFGREGLLDQIKRQVIDSGNVVLLEGNRRAGKSSVLWHLEGSDPIPGWLGVYCSLQGIDGANEGGIPTADVFRGMAYDIVQAMRKLNGTAVLPDGTTLDPGKRLGINKSVRNGISEQAPFQDFRDYLEMILETLEKQGLGLLLMMDEFDKLQEGIDNGVTSPQVPENIRFLVQSYPKFSAILTGSRRLQRMREEYWSALFGLGTRFPVTALPGEAAARLITEPVAKQLSFSSSAVKLAARLTARQPYLLQCLCNRIFDIAAQTDVRSITVIHVEEAAQKLVEDNEHFASLWDYTEFERRRFLLFLLHREEEGADQMRFPMISEKLSQFGIELDQEVLMSDLEYLRELELIDMVGESSSTHYKLTIPMMGDWLDSQKDYNVTLDRAMAEAEDMRETVD